MNLLQIVCMLVWTEEKPFPSFSLFFFLVGLSGFRLSATSPGFFGMYLHTMLVRSYWHNMLLSPRHREDVRQFWDSTGLDQTRISTRFTNQSWSYATLIHQSAALKNWGENLKKGLKKKRARGGSSSCFCLPKILLRGAQSGWEATDPGCRKRSSLSGWDAEYPSLETFRTQLSKFLSNLMQLHSWVCFSFHCFLPA